MFSSASQRKVLFFSRYLFLCSFCTCFSVLSIASTPLLYYLPLIWLKWMIHINPNNNVSYSRYYATLTLACFVCNVVESYMYRCCIHSLSVIMFPLILCSLYNVQVKSDLNFCLFSYRFRETDKFVRKATRTETGGTNI